MNQPKLLAIMLIGVLLVGCQPPNKEKQSYRIGRSARGDVAGGNGTPYQGSPGSGGKYAPPAGKLYGEITRGSNSQNGFQDALQSLLAPQQVTAGFVSGDSGQSTGIRFWGIADTSTGAPINGNSSFTIKKSTARIRIEIYDEFAYQMGEIPIDISALTSGSDFLYGGGYVQGSYAQVAFQDTMGWIILDGSLNQTTYTGNVWFGPGEGQMQYLGQFRVPTCGFFRCQ